MEWRGHLVERATQTMLSLPALDTSGTSGSSKSGVEVGKGLVSLVRMRQRTFRELAGS